MPIPQAQKRAREKETHTGFPPTAQARIQMGRAFASPTNALNGKEQSFTHPVYSGTILKVNAIYQQPIALGWTKSQVQDFAAKVARGLGYRPGQNLEEIVKSLGGKIVKGDIFNTQDTGSITVDGPKQFTIYLSPLSSERRSRFTIAHELGHYVIHSRMGRIPVCVPRDGTGQVEAEANWFAAGFLMPEDEFRQKHSEGWGNAMLAIHFDVSQAAVEVRKQSLGFSI
ncbi:MAG TPA: ImmA/IrrE family metallo-endopeptidase [Candidatus Methylacidiphilales bacterium]|nr:ImmA/IrrE family metallo-endopeptidase [Candidatus Methylacidiphilales bacterium]